MLSAYSLPVSVTPTVSTKPFSELVVRPLVVEEIGDVSLVDPELLELVDLLLVRERLREEDSVDAAGARSGEDVDDEARPNRRISRGLGAVRRELAELPVDPLAPLQGRPATAGSRPQREPGAVQPDIGCERPLGGSRPDEAEELLDDPVDVDRQGDPAVHHERVADLLLGEEGRWVESGRG